MVRVSQTGGTFLDRVVDFFIPSGVVDFLNQSLIEKSWVIINYWSFVHLFAGIGFYFVFPGGIWVWVVANILFEIVEYLLAFGGNPLFVEELVDIVWDLVLSVGGFLVTKIIIEKISKGKLYIP